MVKLNVIIICSDHNANNKFDFQAGVWGCFDEFNRMGIEVLSVVAQQVFSILSALASGLQKFTFEGQEIKLEPLCGIFATMNIGLLLFLLTWLNNDFKLLGDLNTSL